MGSLSAMEDLRVGDVRTHPTCPGSAREADLVRGPAYDGTLSPIVPAPLLASPLSALLSSASKIHHFVMDSVCACLAMHGSAREASGLGKVGPRPPFPAFITAPYIYHYTPTKAYSLPKRRFRNK